MWGCNDFSKGFCDLGVDFIGFYYLLLKLNDLGSDSCVCFFMNSGRIMMVL